MSTLSKIHTEPPIFGLAFYINPAKPIKNELYFKKTSEKPDKAIFQSQIIKDIDMTYKKLITTITIILLPHIAFPQNSDDFEEKKPHFNQEEEDRQLYNTIDELYRDILSKSIAAERLSLYKQLSGIFNGNPLVTERNPSAIRINSHRSVPRAAHDESDRIDIFSEHDQHLRFHRFTEVTIDRRGTRFAPIGSPSFIIFYGARHAYLYSPSHNIETDESHYTHNTHNTHNTHRVNDRFLRIEYNHQLSLRSNGVNIDLAIVPFFDPIPSDEILAASLRAHPQEPLESLGTLTNQQSHISLQGELPPSEELSRMVSQQFESFHPDPSAPSYEPPLEEGAIGGEWEWEWDSLRHPEATAPLRNSMDSIISLLRTPPSINAEPSLAEELLPEQEILSSRTWRFDGTRRVEECGICLEHTADTQLPCQHESCHQCITRMQARTHNHCPICLQSIGGGCNIERGQDLFQLQQQQQELERQQGWLTTSDFYTEDTQNINLPSVNADQTSRNMPSIESPRTRFYPYVFAMANDMIRQLTQVAHSRRERESMYTKVLDQHNIDLLREGSIQLIDSNSGTPLQSISRSEPFTDISSIEDILSFAPNNNAEASLLYGQDHAYGVSIGRGRITGEHVHNLNGRVVQISYGHPITVNIGNTSETFIIERSPNELPSTEGTEPVGAGTNAEGGFVEHGEASLYMPSLQEPPGQGWRHWFTNLLVRYIK